MTYPDHVEDGERARSERYPSSEDELVRRWSYGDNGAGHNLFLRHHASIARFFLSKVGVDCDELIRETFRVSRLRAKTCYGDRGFCVLLFMVAREVLIEHWRSRPAGAAIIERRPHGRERVRAQLPLDLLIMLELRDWEHMSLDDIAWVFGLDTRTIIKSLHHARQLLGGARVGDHVNPPLPTLPATRRRPRR